MPSEHQPDRSRRQVKLFLRKAATISPAKRGWPCPIRITNDVPIIVRPMTQGTTVLSDGTSSRWQDGVVTTNDPRVIGMLGGMSWESSAQYYRLANELVRERLGGLHSARVLLASVDFNVMQKSS
jgi:hypothetical protein